MGVGANATAAGATHVHACTAPSAHLAGASGVIRRDFDDEGAFALLGDELRGTARLDRGALLLTEGVNLATFTPRNAYGKNGQWPLRQPVGSLILNRGQRGRGGGGAPAATIRQFDASFELQVGGGGAHDGKSLEGLSFSLGPLREGRAEHIEMYADLRGGRPRTIGIDPENRRIPDAAEWTEWDLDAPIGGEGLWRGLNIEMEYSMGANFDMANSHFDWNNPPLPKTAMRVRYEQEIVYEAFVDQALVTRTWANVTVRLDAHGLTVTHNGRLYVEELPIFGWAPRPHWQFTLGASTHGLGRFFRVDNLRIRSGDLLQSGAVPMAIAINGQDYAPVPGGFAYFTPVRASGVSPTAGPVHGHTRLSVSGSLLAPAPQPSAASRARPSPPRAPPTATSSASPRTRRRPTTPRTTPPASPAARRPSSRPRRRRRSASRSTAKRSRRRPTCASASTRSPTSRACCRGRGRRRAAPWWRSRAAAAATAASPSASTTAAALATAPRSSRRWRGPTTSTATG